jgi:hypothetical protein
MTVRVEHSCAHVSGNDERHGFGRSVALSAGLVQFAAFGRMARRRL